MAKKTAKKKTSKKKANPNGRPPDYKTPEAMQKKIEQFFSDGIPAKTMVVGKGPKQRTIQVKQPTITGLCLYLGFCSRQSFYDYEKKPKFTYTIKRARMLIEHEYEHQLNSGNAVAGIFGLKQFGWVDKQAVELSGEVGITGLLKALDGNSRGLPK
jgi:hypothetical protein